MTYTPRTFATLADMAACVGQELALSDWHTVTQTQIDQFAQATGDHQWIHVDPVRAAAGPFGAPIAHGFLTLSLLAKFGDESMRITASARGVNYGLNKVRFINPVRVDSRIRARFKLLSATSIKGGPGGQADGYQFVNEVSIEIEGASKPACIAESITLRF